MSAAGIEAGRVAAAAVICVAGGYIVYKVMMALWGPSGFLVG